MEGKEELLKLAHKQFDQAAKLLNAAGEEPLAEEADALAATEGDAVKGRGRHEDWLTCITVYSWIPVWLASNTLCAE